MQRLLSHPKLGDCLLFATFTTVFAVILHG
jgi:hypothetical protein